MSTALLTPAQRRNQARLGGLTTMARHDGAKIAARARSGFLAKFEKHVDPDGTLPPDDRQRRARAALRLHMSRLSHKAAKARTRNAGR